MYEINEIKNMELNQLWLFINPDTQKVAWEKAQKHSNAIARYNAYVNNICLQTFLKWFSDWLIEEVTIQPTIWSNEQALPTFWEIVNGTAIQLGETRLIIIPTETTDLEELRVPQEWVDIPNWMGDYYLAVEVNLESDENECWIRVHGFATHRQLKYEGIYDQSDRTYSLAVDQLTESLEVMQIICGLNVRAEVAQLPQMEASAIDKLLQLFGDASIYSPRLRTDIPFVEWATLLASEKYRQQLYNRRMGLLVPQPIDLKAWLQKLTDQTQIAMDEIWQTYETLFVPLTPVWNNRGVEKNHEGSYRDAIAAIIPLLDPQKSDERTRCQAAGVLGKIGIGNRDAIKALTELLQTANDEETRWEASLSLGKIDPGNPLAGIKKARLIDLGMQLESYQIGLVVAIMPKVKDKIGVFLQVQPLKDSERLPPNLKVSVLSELGQPIAGLQKESRRNDTNEGIDKFLVLRFSPPSGTLFRVQISLGDRAITEDFIA